MKTSTIRITDQHGAPLAQHYVLVRREGDGGEAFFSIQLDADGSAELESLDGETFEIALPEHPTMYAYVENADYSIN